MTFRPRQTEMGRLVYLGLQAALIIGFVSFVLAAGVPAMRHDWDIPLTSEGWRAFIGATASGWDVDGIGLARPYPTLFLLGPILGLSGIAFGSIVTLALFLASIAALFTSSAVRISRLCAFNDGFGVALAALLLYNPWVYEKIVAGHLGMLFAASACAYLTAELLHDKPRAVVIVLCGYVAAFQIQFAFVACFLAVVVRPQLQTLRFVVAGVTLSLLPTIVGMVLSSGSLMGIPYTTSWQYANSVDPVGGLFLDGYSQQYTAGAHGLFFAAGALFAAASLMGLVVELYTKADRRRSARLAIASLLVWGYSTGLKGPFSGLYMATLHVRATLVFRELFDLIGLLTILYVVLTAIGGGRSFLVRGAACVSAILMVAAWTSSPPSHWWISSAKLQSIAVPSSPVNSRYALLPWHQPLQFNGEYSGADPDSYARSGNVTPVNEYGDGYPQNVALANYQISGDTRDLESLSVARIYERPQFSSDIAGAHIAVPMRLSVRRRGSDVTLKAKPELSLIELPPFRDTPGPMHDLTLFCGGNPAALTRYLRIASASVAPSDPRKAWIPAPLAFSAYPAIGNELGGVFTTESSARLPVPDDAVSRVLAYVNGKLLSNIGLLSETTGSWKWLDLKGSSALHCQGTCAVAAWQRNPCPRNVLPHYQPHARPVTFTAALPFLVFGALPGGTDSAHSVLLYRTRFDQSWLLLGIPSTGHIEVSSIFNGYVLKPSSNRKFVLVELTAALQAVAMVVSVIGVAALIWLLTFRHRARGNGTP